MRGEKSRWRVGVAILGATVTFGLVAVAIYHRMANVSVNGWVSGGPTSLTGATAGLFGGGFAALVVLVLLLQRR
jgi:hypothetical protein